MKVQSFHANPSRTQYSHARPAPTLVQYLNRPKTTNGKWPSKQGTKNVDFNIVGVQTGMANSDNGAPGVAKSGVSQASGE